MTELRFKPHYRVAIHPPEHVFLLSEREHVVLRGRLYVAVAPYLKDGSDLSAIQAALADRVPADKVAYAIQRLRDAGHLSSGPNGLPLEQAAFWEAEGHAPLAKARVAVRGLGVASDDLTALCAANGLLTGDEAALELVLADDYLNPALEDFNRRALTEGRPWLLAKPVGTILWVGPLFAPGGACWACLAERLAANRAVEMFLHEQGALAGPPGLSRAALPSTVATALGLVATEAARWLASGNSALRDRVWTFDTNTLETAWHHVVRRPQCPVCGSAVSRASARIVLEARPKAPTSDGGFRSAPAEETFERYRHHISPITGAVSELERVSTPGPIHVYRSGANKSRPFQSWGAQRRSLRSHSAGKGIDDMQARTSALCEALERYSGVFQGDEPRRRATFEQVRDEAIHPNQLLLFSEAQYATRETWNRDCPPHLYVPRPFEDDRAIEWTPVWSLTNERAVYVPTAYCYYDYPLADDHVFCIADSNGCAAGSSLEDAILQGFLELVERDAVALWWENRIPRPGIDLDSLASPYLRQVRAYYASLARDIWALDLTADLGIPVVAALSRRVDQPQEDIIMAFGAHLDPRYALLRAVTELHQMLPPVLHAQSGRGYASDLPWEIDWWQTATLQTDPYLAPDPAQAAVRLQDRPSLEAGDLRADVLVCVELARRQGLEVLALDQTRPDIGLPVVRVIVPGLRHFWRRHAPGRLYDVPVRLGWLPRPTAESDLNPRLISV
ncbi:MAG: TOMM precursor leader peptide-binding protein [Chloroflexota bacterium]